MAQFGRRDRYDVPMVEVLEGRKLLHGVPSAAAPAEAAELPAAVDAAISRAGWNTLASAPQRLFEAMGEVVDGKLYVFGGFYNSGIDVIDQVHVYDPAANSWSALQDTPMPQSHVGTVTDGTTVYFAGGFRNDWFGDASDEFWMYTPATDTWTRGPDLPVFRGAGGLVLIDRTLHFYGGLNADGETDSGDHYALDLDNQSAGWVEKAPMPNPRNHFGYEVLEGKAYAIGGQHALDEANGLDADVHAYDPATDTWTQVASLPAARSHQHNATIVDGGRLLTVGGTDPGNVAVAQILQYDPIEDTWTGVGQLPLARSASVASVIDGNLVVTTGTPTGTLPQTTTWSRPLETLIVGNDPDLTLTIDPPNQVSVVGGAAEKGFVQVQNEGGSNFKGAVKIELALSSDPELDDGDAILATKDANLRLGVGKNRRLPLKFTYPTDASGDYFLVARVTPTVAISEATAGNNIGVAIPPVTVGAPVIDLTGSLIAPKAATVATGKSLKAAVGLQNAGNTTLRGRTSFTLALRPLAATDASQDIAAGTVTKAVNVLPGQGKPVAVKTSALTGVPAGGYLLVAQVSPASGSTDGLELLNNVIVGTDEVQVT